MVGGVGMEVLEAAGADPYAGFRPSSMSFRHVAWNSEALMVRGPWGLPMLAVMFPILRAELVVYAIVTTMVIVYRSCPTYASGMV